MACMLLSASLFLHYAGDACSDIVELDIKPHRDVGGISLHNVNKS